MLVPFRTVPCDLSVSRMALEGRESANGWGLQLLNVTGKGGWGSGPFLLKSKTPLPSKKSSRLSLSEDKEMHPGKLQN